MPTKTRSLNIKKKKVICLQCKTEVLESDDAMECDSCCKTFHSLCTHLNKVQIEALVKDPALEFKCHFCKPESDNRDGISTVLMEMREMKETMKFMSAQYDSILNGVKKNSASIKSLQKENKNLREDVKQLKSTVAFLNGERVRNDCIINGIQAETNSKPTEIVLDVAKKVGADICEVEIEDAYFINRNKETSKTAVVVKFINKQTKATFMKEKKKLMQIDVMKNVYINDFLTKECLEILKYAKSLKAVGFKFIYVKAGKVFAKKDDNARQIILKSLNDVDLLLSKHAVGKGARQRLSVPQDEDDGSEDDDDNDGYLSPN